MGHESLDLGTDLVAPRASGRRTFVIVLSEEPDRNARTESGVRIYEYQDGALSELGERPREGRLRRVRSAIDHTMEIILG